MQYKIFAVPALMGTVEEEQLNHFLRTVRVVDVERRFESVGGIAYWCFCVSYLPVSSSVSTIDGHRERKGKPDYKAELSPEVFARFELMRKVRRRMADEASLPPYVIFTDAELAIIASMEEPNADQIARLDGVDKKRAAGYGEVLLSRFLEEDSARKLEMHEKSGASV